MDWDGPEEPKASDVMGLANYSAVHAATPRQRLQYELAQLEARKDTIKQLLKVFDSNPGVEEALNLMRKLGV